MLAPDPLSPLHSTVIRIIGQRDGTDMQQLHALLTQNGQMVSLQHLYKVVNRMIDTHIILRIKGKLFVHSLWLSSLSDFVANLNEHATTHVSAEHMKNGRVEWKAQSLKDLFPLYAQALLEVTQQEEGDTVYEYCTHPWWLLGCPQAERSLAERLASRGISRKKSIGNDAALDYEATKAISHPQYHVEVTPQHPFPKSGYACATFGSYVVSIILPPALSQLLQVSIFSSKEKQVSMDGFQQIFSMRTSVKMTITHNPQEAQSLREKMLSARTTATTA